MVKEPTPVKIPMGMTEYLRSMMEIMNPDFTFDVTAIIECNQRPKPVILSTRPAEQMPDLLESICDDLVRREYKEF